MDNSMLFFWSAMLSVIGFGFFSYGKKQKAVVPLISGVTLMLFPYVVSSVNEMLAIGAALVVLPFVVRL